MAKMEKQSVHHLEHTLLKVIKEEAIYTSLIHLFLHLQYAVVIHVKAHRSFNSIRGQDGESYLSPLPFGIGTLELFHIEEEEHKFTGMRLEKVMEEDGSSLCSC